MSKNLIEQFNSEDMYVRFNKLPHRIFLDTNILQYLQDFGEYIFDHHRENNNYFIGPKGRKITKQSNLYKQIIALREIFLGLDRTNIEFALSETIEREVVARKNSSFYQWFCDVWEHWQAVVEEYEGIPFSEVAKEKYDRGIKDKSLLGNLSKKDREIILDAIRFDCNTILTIDRFADKNKQLFVYNRYALMILKPLDFYEILKPFQALWF